MSVRVPKQANPSVPIGMNWNENADCVSCKLLKEWWPETGSKPPTPAFSGLTLATSRPAAGGSLG